MLNLLYGKTNFLIKLVYELDNILLFPILYMPGAVGNKLRYLYYKRKLRLLGRSSVINVGVQISGAQFISIGENTHIDKFCILVAGPVHKGRRILTYKQNINYKGEIGELRIGNRVHIAPYVLINAHGGVSIGNDLTIAAGAKIFSISHHYRNICNPDDKTFYKFGSNVPEEEQCIIVGPVVIENNTAVGINSVVMPGVTIGKNSWLGMMSYTMHDIPPNTIAIGTPAKVVRRREPAEV